MNGLNWAEGYSDETPIHRRTDHRCFIGSRSEGQVASISGKFLEVSFLRPIILLPKWKKYGKLSDILTMDAKRPIEVI